MDPLWQILITVVGSVIASSGFWAFVLSRYSHNDAYTKMLMGLGHDRILYLGMKYINRGRITRDEYENLIDYLHKPYEKLGGNGSVTRIIAEVNRLPICSELPITDQLIDNCE